MACMAGMELWQGASVSRGEETYEFSKLEYVLPVFVTALSCAIWLSYEEGRNEGKEDSLPLCFGKTC